MSDVYIPGVRSRFNSDQIIEGLMNVERIPRDRTEQGVENLRVQRGYWQEIGRRITSLRDSARFLYSFENPFNERLARSGDDSVITAVANRTASEQTFSFSVKQTAGADRFLSRPLDERTTRIEAGTYTFSVGNDEVTINYRGGTLRNFVETINNRGRDKIAASLIAVQSGKLSLLIESKIQGAENRLGFSADAATLAVNIGMMERGNDTRQDISITENTVRKSGQNSANININNGALITPPMSTASLPFNLTVSADSPLVLRLETQTRVETGEALNLAQPPSGPSVPSGGSVTYGGITVENAPSTAPLPEFTPPAPPPRNDDMGVLSLTFSDGTSAKLPAISDSNSFTARQYNLTEVARGKTIVSLNVENSNTHREVTIGKVEVLDPTSTSGGLRPLNAVSTARDAIISMEGIEIIRPSNSIDDLIPGVTLNVRGVSERPVELRVTGNVEAVKDAIISFVGNYNLLMTELNVLTRRDERVIDEISYLTPEEKASMRQRLGAFASDSTLTTLRGNLQRTVTAPYPTSLERELALLTQIGITTGGSRGTGYDPSRLRGYLEIPDESILDAALETKMPAIKELFGNNTSGEGIADTGVGFNVNELVRSFVEIGGIVSLKTSTIDSRINQDERRIQNLDRQLAAREQDLRIQYARMEAAYARMEQLSNSLDNFSQQNRGNR
ncbi:MAG: flagellar filament capping protein FliD [Treponema sp.]|jgi:flagellar hook-associated protein 2|nr:flagellar filament capping protein FliD [Treponema sp.]